MFCEACGQPMYMLPGRTGTQEFGCSNSACVREHVYYVSLRLTAALDAWEQRMKLLEGVVKELRYYVYVLGNRLQVGGTAADCIGREIEGEKPASAT